MGTFTLITAPTDEPITVNEAKELLRIDHADDDARIEAHIKAARGFAENYLNLKLFTQTWDLSLPKFTGVTIELGLWPLQSIDSVKYWDTSSPTTEVTLTENTDYYADIVTPGGRIKTIGGWPSVDDKFNPVTVRMTAGYSDLDDIPEEIKDGIKYYVAYLYDADLSMKKIAEEILWPHRRLA